MTYIETNDGALKFPDHLELIISHNSHKGYYENITTYLDTRHITAEDLTPEDMEEIIKADSIWEVQWYPTTPTSFYFVVASTLKKCLELANSDPTLTKT